MERSAVVSRGWRAQGWSWTESGFYVAGRKSEEDLISEVYVSDTPPDAPLPDIITDQPCKTLRDEFEEKAALAILSGYYSNPSLGPSEDTFGDVWDAAKRFVEARKK
jgi:hypothetical protein